MKKRTDRKYSILEIFSMFIGSMLIIGVFFLFIFVYAHDVNPNKKAILEEGEEGTLAELFRKQEKNGTGISGENDKTYPLDVHNDNAITGPDNSNSTETNIYEREYAKNVQESLERKLEAEKTIGQEYNPVSDKTDINEHQYTGNVKESSPIDTLDKNSIAKQNDSDISKPNINRPEIAKKEKAASEQKNKAGKVNSQQNEESQFEFNNSEQFNSRKLRDDLLLLLTPKEEDKPMEMEKKYKSTSGMKINNLEENKSDKSVNTVLAKNEKVKKDEKKSGSVSLEKTVFKEKKPIIENKSDQKKIEEKSRTLTKIFQPEKKAIIVHTNERNVKVPDPENKEVDKKVKTGSGTLIENKRQKGNKSEIQTGDKKDKIEVATHSDVKIVKIDKNKLSKKIKGDERPNEPMGSSSLTWWIGNPKIGEPNQSVSFFSVEKAAASLVGSIRDDRLTLDPSLFYISLAGKQRRAGPDGTYAFENSEIGETNILLKYGNEIVSLDSIDLKPGENRKDYNFEKFIPALMVRHFEGDVPDNVLFSPIPEQVFWQGNGSFKRIALTLDDGFSRDDKLLDLLEQNGIRCTVFLIGGRDLANKRPDWIKRMDDMGFEVCNHTYNHSPITQLTDAALEKEIKDTQRVVTRTTMKKYPFFRPPYGIYDHRTLKVVASLGYILITWSNSIGDSVQGNNTESQIKYVLNHLKNGDIILCHFGAKNTYDVIKQLIPQIKKRGYEFATISEVLEGL